MRTNPFYLIKFFLLATVLCAPAVAQTEQTTQCKLSDIDQDDDGLIEICNLNQLNGIRYQLDGTAYRRGEGRRKITRGCPGNVCIGYELTRNLDFKKESDYRNNVENKIKWNNGGWQPIGSINISGSGKEVQNGFRGIFEGNGYTISNLFINMENIENKDATGWGLRGVGLFGFTTQTAVIRNIGLLNLRIEKNDSPQARPDARRNDIYYLKGVGGLVGINGGKVINSYVSGSVNGGTFDSTLEANNRQGRDKVGGLVGTNLNKIVNSYAAANVTGKFTVGGLVGENCLSFHIGCPANSAGEIINSYARGTVSSLADGGGLVGANRHRITNSYANPVITRITHTLNDKPEDDDFGGLAAINGHSQEGILSTRNLPAPTITASYWQNDDSSLSDIGRVGSGRSTLSYTAGQSASDLKFPDDATGIYSGWHVADWNFGTPNQYPVLKYTVDEDPSTCSNRPRRKDIDPPECGSLLPNQGTGLRDIDIKGVAWIPYFSSDETDYTVLVDDSVQNISLLLNAYNSTANITIGDIGTAIGSTETTISLSENTAITVTVSDSNSIYNLRFEKRSIAIREEIELRAGNNIGINADGTVDENSEIMLLVVAGGNYDFRWEQSPTLDYSQLHGSTPSISVFIPLDFVDGEIASTRSLTFTLTVSDASDSITLSKTLIVRNVPNETIGPLRVDIDADNDGLIEIYYLEDLDAIRYQPDGKGYRASTTAKTITNGCPNTGCVGYELARDLDFDSDASYFSISNKKRWTVDDYEDNSDEGWLPIGGINQSFHNTFEGNGYTISNLQINRTNPDTSDNVGLFGQAGQQTSGGTFRHAKIVNLGLLDINIRGKLNVGGLAASSDVGLIANSYATGTIVGDGNVGGLVGDARLTTIANSHAIVNATGKEERIGGLVGRGNFINITNSYASGNVRGAMRVGGLVGTFIGRRGSSFGISNSYASGCVMGDNFIGGIAGTTSAGGSITNSYTTGCVIGSESRINYFVGGLVGRNIPGDARIVTGLNRSYWARKPDSLFNDIGLSRYSFYTAGLTAESLKSPTDASGIYGQWSTTDWDFGNSTIYPALRHAGPINYENFPFSAVTIFGSATADTCDTDPQTSLPQCGTLLPNQRNSGLSALFLLENGEISNKDLRFRNRSFSSLIYDYIIPDLDSDKFQILPFAVNGDNATITITERGEDINYFSNRSSGDASEEIVLRDTVRILTIEVIDEDISTLYTLIVPGPNLSISETFSIEPANEDGTVNEGSTITLTPVVTGGTEPYDHAWTHSLDDPTSVSELNAPTLSFKIPENFVGTGDNRDITFILRVDDGDGSSTSRSTVLRVNRTDNGPPDIETEISTTTITVRVKTDPDGDGDRDFTYQWQERKLGIDWIDLSDVSTNTFVIPNNTPGSTRYRVLITHTDAQNHTVTTRIGPFRIKADDDGDNLIEIYYLEDLDAIRYQLDGSAYNTSNSLTTKVTFGCIENRCSGYELDRDLNFGEPEHYSDSTNMNTWRTNTGWQPIGGLDGGLSTTFEGNDLTISNLFINSPTSLFVALFNHLTEDGKIQNLGLLDANIQGLAAIGGLVASNAGLILNSYARGSITGLRIPDRISEDNQIGGLVGINLSRGRIINSHAYVAIVGSGDLVRRLRLTVEPYLGGLGGLVGVNQGTINGSYATGDIVGENITDVGGLVGTNRNHIYNSFAAGNVSGILNVGGLVGSNDNPDSGDPTPRISNSFATGNVQGGGDNSQNLGGLIGRHTGLRSAIANTYSSGVVSGHTNLGGLIGTMGNDDILRNSYTTSLVIGTSTTSVLGGLIGNYDSGSATANASYWQNDGSELPDVGRGNITIEDRYKLNGSVGRSATQLKAPTTTTGIYSEWSTEDWDFGTNNEYPILGYGKGFAPTGDPQCDTNPNTELPDCGPILGGQQPTLVALELEESSNSGDVIIYRQIELNRRFDPEVLEYEAEFNVGTIRIRLTPVANNTSHTISYKIGTQNFQELTSSTSFIHTLMSDEDSATIVIKVEPHSRSSMRGTREYTITLNRSKVKSLLVRTRLFLEGPVR